MLRTAVTIPNPATVVATATWPTIVLFRTAETEPAGAEAEATAVCPGISSLTATAPAGANAVAPAATPATVALRTVDTTPGCADPVAEATRPDSCTDNRAIGTTPTNDGACGNCALNAATGNIPFDTEEASVPVDCAGAGRSATDTDDGNSIYAAVIVAMPEPEMVSVKLPDALISSCPKSQ